ncbi:hypothetical protein Taro_028650, partial [Colocasia esculenta]|nr:hypothetical protein [Colocasia esculenta]
HHFPPSIMPYTATIASTCQTTVTTASSPISIIIRRSPKKPNLLLFWRGRWILYNNRFAVWESVAPTLVGRESVAICLPIAAWNDNVLLGCEGAATWVDDLAHLDYDE